MNSEHNPMWKGDLASISAIHQWVRSRKSKTKLCERCHKNKPYDLANISQKYKRDVDDYLWLCRSCHNTKHNKVKNFKIKNNNIGKNNPNWKGGKEFCKCGNEKSFYAVRCKKCWTKEMTGKNNPNYKNGSRCK